MAKRHQWTNAERKLAAAANTTLQQQLLADALGVTANAVRRFRYDHGLSGPAGPRRKMYAEDIADIMECKAAGDSNARIARRYGVDANSIKCHLYQAKLRGFTRYPKYKDAQE